MDPTATYRDMWDFYHDGEKSGDKQDFFQALEAAHALLTWFSIGGFRPHGVTGNKVKADCKVIIGECADRGIVLDAV